MKLFQLKEKSAFLNKNICTPSLFWGLNCVLFWKVVLYETIKVFKSFLSWPHLLAGTERLFPTSESIPGWGGNERGNR